MRLAGKAGLITGAASGIGRAGALRFAAEGAAVAVVDVDADRTKETVAAIEKGGGKAIALVGDLRDSDFSRSIVAQSKQSFGKLDFAWCNAGYPGPSAVEDVDLSMLEVTINLNLTSLVLTSAAALPELRLTQGSLLRHLVDRRPACSDLSPIYSAVKFGVVGFARALASRYARSWSASMRFVQAELTRRCKGCLWRDPTNTPSTISTAKSLLLPARNRRRWAELRNRTRSPTRRCFSPPTRRHTSRAQF